MSDSRINRRQFTGLTTAGIAGGVLGFSSSAAAGDGAGEWDPDKPPVVTGKPLTVQPVLTYRTFKPVEAASWRSWSPINTEQAVAEEAARISKELNLLSAGADFPLRILPLVKVRSAQEVLRLREREHDVIMVYPATGSGDVLRACFPKRPERDTLIFVRHRSGPIYYWYEALSTRYLSSGTEEELRQNSADNHGRPAVDDVVVDDYADVVWRLRALYGIKNFIGQRIVALGGARGKYDPKAPEVARERYRLQVIDVSFDELNRRVAKAKEDAGLVSRAEKRTEKYFSQPDTTLLTKKQHVVDAFLLYDIFKDWMHQYNAPALTIANCMSGILPIAQTTPCLVLSWLNDEGLLGFCESDFVVIPSGILLHYISGKPVFLHNSTFPHKGLVTCAHCTAPRRMDGNKYEPVKIMTHYESDAGAAPKVEMTVGQQVTFVDPEYSSGR